MNIEQVQKYLQSRSEQTKNRIMVVTSGIVVLVLLAAWSVTLKNKFSGLTENDIIPHGIKGVNTEPKYLSIETVEDRGEKKYVYFRITNDTTDILNFSPTDSIELLSGERKLKPEKVVTRQETPFSSKILSKTTAYGILVFNNQDVKGGKILFDDLYFEMTPHIIFMEEVEVNLRKTEEPRELRS